MTDLKSASVFFKSITSQNSNRRNKSVVSNKWPKTPDGWWMVNAILKLKSFKMKLRCCTSVTSWLFHFMDPAVYELQILAERCLWARSRWDWRVHLLFLGTGSRSRPLSEAPGLASSCPGLGFLFSVLLRETCRLINMPAVLPEVRNDNYSMLRWVIQLPVHAVPTRSAKS